MNRMRVVKGDVLKVEEGIIIHGCNNHKVFGAGIAKQIKHQFPDVYEIYRSASSDLGTVSVVDVSSPLNPNSKYIINAITQDNFGYSNKYVSYDAIETCFENVVDFWATVSVNFEKDLPLCFPKIGSGLGGGRWEIIKNIIEVVVPSNIELVLYDLEVDPSLSDAGSSNL